MPVYIDPTESQLVVAERRRKSTERRLQLQERSLNQKMRDWCRGRNSMIRSPLVLWFLGVSVAYLQSPERGAQIDLINGYVHHFGHRLGYALTGPVFATMSGLFVQIALPVAVLEYFRRKLDYFGVAAGMGWLGTNLLWNVSYIRGAEKSIYPPSLQNISEPIHDWNYIFSGLGSFAGVSFVASMLMLTGIALMIGSVYFGGVQLYYMLTLEERRASIDRRVRAFAANHGTGS